MNIRESFYTLVMKLCFVCAVWDLVALLGPRQTDTSTIYTSNTKLTIVKANQVNVQLAN
jgi:hypothetical protein